MNSIDPTPRVQGSQLGYTDAQWERRADGSETNGDEDPGWTCTKWMAVSSEKLEKCLHPYAWYFAMLTYTSVFIYWTYNQMLSLKLCVLSSRHSNDNWEMKMAFAFLESPWDSSQNETFCPLNSWEAHRKMDPNSSQRIKPENHQWACRSMDVVVLSTQQLWNGKVQHELIREPVNTNPWWFSQRDSGVGERTMCFHV